MSYGLAFTETSLGHLRQLPAWLQEEMLDEIEGLLGRSGDRSGVLDFVRSRETGVHYVFVTYAVERAANTVRVMTIGHYLRGKE